MKWITFIVFFAIYLFSVQAQPSIPSEEYQSIENLQDPTFYDRPGFDWTQIPADKIWSVPVEKLDYHSLSKVQRKGTDSLGGLSHKQILANLDKIKDFQDVNVYSASRALREYTGANFVNLEGSSRIENGHLVSFTQDGDINKVPIEAMKDANLYAYEDGKIHVFFHHNRLVDVPLKEGTYTVSGVPVFINTPHGFFETDVLKIKDGKYYIGKYYEDSSLSNNLRNREINGAKIECEESDVRVLFADSLDHVRQEIEVSSEPVVVFTKNEIALFSKENTKVKVRIGQSGATTEDYVRLNVVTEQREQSSYFPTAREVAQMRRYDFKPEDPNIDIPQIVIDNNDHLTLTASDGDSAILENRESENLVPLLIHQSSPDGRLDVASGRLQFTLSPELMGAPAVKEIDRLGRGYFLESTAVQIQSDAHPDKSLLINAYDQYELADKGAPKVHFNTQLDANVPISPYVEDNLLQSGAGLSHKYPELNFEWYSEVVLPPFAAHILDSYFEKYPHELAHARQIKFDQRSKNGYAASDRETIGSEIGIGAFTLDFYSRQGKIPYRPMTPTQFLHHEITAHAAEQTLAIQEREARLNDPSLNDVPTFRELVDDRIRKEFDEIAKDPEIRRLMGRTPSSPEVVFNEYWFLTRNLEDPSNKAKADKFVEIVEGKYGMPALYAMHWNRGYPEATSTLFEEDPEFIKMKVDDRSNNNRRQLTAFILLAKWDAGSPHPQHEYIMKDYCKTNPDVCTKCHKNRYQLLCDPNE